ncbi:MAG: hypothetical protein MUF58_20125 [Arcicella sp.]|jgi:hypothetical protein|nr:hypothetical protein [Arcicella sp.]
MNQKLTFSKDFWSSTYEIKDGNRVLVRTEKKSIWSYDSIVKIDDEEFLFDVNGIFSNTINIYDSQNQLIGTVDLSTWSSKATIDLKHSKLYYFRKTDFFSSEWEIANDQQALIYFKKDWFVSGGTIDVYEENKTLLAIGVFLISLYQQKAAATA